MTKPRSASSPISRANGFAEILSAADVHLVSLKPTLEGPIVPSKIYGIAAVGRPTIFIGDPDAPACLRVSTAVSPLPMGESAALARAVQDLAIRQSNARRWEPMRVKRSLPSLEKSAAVADWRALLDELKEIPCAQESYF